MNRFGRVLSLGVITPSVLVVSVICGGCRAQEAAVSPGPAKPVIPTHRPVPAPPQASGNRLWVALDDHLGRGTKRDQPAPTLTLRSAGASPLVLRDGSASGVSQPLATAPNLSISWRLEPLAEPVKVSRLVAGPYASFETADRVAQRWRQQGVQALVAHPGEWEVWAPETASVLEGVATRPWRNTITSVVRPVLEGIDGDLKTLAGPLLLEAPDGLSWKGGVMQGPFRLQPDAYGSWTLLEQVPLERYLEGVVPHEIGAGSPEAALQAQAVLARTWALANSHRFGIDGYHLCSDTQCQVYSDPRYAGSAVRQAIKATTGQVLQWNGKPISAVYHASNGGVMASAPEAWAMAPAAYLQAQADGDQGWLDAVVLPLNDADAVRRLVQAGRGAYGAGHPLFRWTRTYTASQLERALASQSPGVVQGVAVVKRGPSGRVLTLRIEGDGPGSPVDLRLDAIRRTLRRLPSTLFTLETSGEGVWRFNGGGFGHGAGLSQAGAIDLASRGWSVQRILQHYYPGATLAPLAP